MGVASILKTWTLICGMCDGICVRFCWNSELPTFCSCGGLYHIAKSVQAPQIANRRALHSEEILKDLDEMVTHLGG